MRRRINNSGMSLIEVMILTGALSALTAVMLQNALSSGKSFNIMTNNWAWQNLLRSIEVSLSDPATCQSMLGGWVIGSPPYTTPLNLPYLGSPSTENFLTVGQTIGTFRATAIALVRNTDVPIRTTTFGGQSQNLIQTYLRIEATSEVGGGGQPMRYFTGVANSDTSNIVLNTLVGVSSQRTGQCSLNTDANLPAGSLFWFNSDCPSGWEEYIDAEAKFLIGANTPFPVGSTGGAWQYPSISYTLSASTSYNAGNFSSHNHPIPAHTHTHAHNHAMSPHNHTYPYGPGEQQQDTGGSSVHNQYRSTGAASSTYNAWSGWNSSFVDSAWVTLNSITGAGASVVNNHTTNATLDAHVTAPPSVIKRLCMKI